MNLAAFDEYPKTPELDVVRAVFLDGGRVLLVQEFDDENWKLPGGKTHQGETIGEAIKRELMEELGIEVDLADIINYVPASIPDSDDIRHIVLFKPVSEDDIKSTDEVKEAKYFDLSDLPPTKFQGHISTAVAYVRKKSK